MRHCQGGFTLVEVLVATTIVVTVSVGTAQLLAMAVRDEGAARLQLSMSAAAATKLDEIAAAIANAPAPAASMGSVDRAVDGYSDVIIASGASFERRWIIAPLAAYGARAVVIVLRIVPAAARSAPDLEVSTIAEAAAP